MILYEVAKMNSTGYAIAPYNLANNGIMDLANASIDSTIALFPSNMLSLLLRRIIFITSALTLLVTIYIQTLRGIYISSGRRSKLCLLVEYTGFLQDIQRMATCIMHRSAVDIHRF